MGILDFIKKFSSQDDDDCEKIVDLASLGEYIKKNSSVRRNRIKIKSILKDIMPHENLKINLLLMGYDESVFSLVNKNLNDEDIFKFKNKLQSNHGIDDEKADWIITTWLSDVFKKNLPSDSHGAITYNENEANDNEINIASTPVKQAQQNTPSETDLLVYNLHKQIYYYPSKYCIGNKGYSDSRTYIIPDELKKLCLHILCKNQIKEDRILHLQVDDNFNEGYCIAYDRIYFWAQQNHCVIKYIEIERVDETEITDTWGEKIVLKITCSTKLKVIHLCERLHNPGNFVNSPLKNKFYIDSIDISKLKPFLVAVRGVV